MRYALLLQTGQQRGRARMLSIGVLTGGKPRLESLSEWPVEFVRS